jgi:hypothetical protein
MGGLGNQLFQVGLGLNIQKELNREVAYTGILLDRKGFGTHRDLEVGTLIKVNRQPIFAESRLILQRILGGMGSSVFVTDSTGEPFLLSQIKSNTKVVCGYFQQLDLIDNVGNEIETKFSQSPRFSSLVNAERKNQIAVHIRLGDYRTLRSANKFHGLTTADYYVRAIRKHFKDSGITEIVIVSDEPQLAYDLLAPKISENVFNIGVMQSGNSIDHLAEISSSTAIVGSNSSFSWWGAWLASRNHDSRIIMPKPWFSNPLIKVNYLMDKKWFLMDRELS